MLNLCSAKVPKAGLIALLGESGGIEIAQRSHSTDLRGRGRRLEIRHPCLPLPHPSSKSQRRQSLQQLRLLQLLPWQLRQPWQQLQLLPQQIPAQHVVPHVRQQPHQHRQGPREAARCQSPEMDWLWHRASLPQVRGSLVLQRLGQRPVWPHSHPPQGQQRPTWNCVGPFLTGGAQTDLAKAAGRRLSIYISKV